MSAADHQGLHEATEILKDESVSAIGTYKYGWAPLAESTVARKGSDAPLLETGEMKDSISTEVGHGEAWVYTNDPKFNFHEYGTSRMPARPVFRNALAHKGQAAADAVGKSVAFSIFR